MKPLKHLKDGNSKYLLLIKLKPIMEKFAFCYSKMQRFKNVALALFYGMAILFSLPSFAQQVKGKVVDENNEPVIGAFVIEVGTQNGTSTDVDGMFTLDITGNSNKINISYIGFQDQEVDITDQSFVNVQLMEGLQLDEVVVTALGISREKKGLTYAVDEVDGEELSTVKDVNVINALSGKTPGLFINRSSSGVGGSTRIVLRGNKSTTNNDPLYVINGIPMTNNRRGQQNGVFGGGVDTGDGISNINPDDIESMTVLKGASAAALYGSQAANGVILITTKQGQAGVPKVSVSSSYITENAAFIPELQFRYGQTAEGAEFSWGGPVNSPDHVKDFFQTGTNFINSFSISGGTDRSTTYFSYSNTSANGIMPTNELGRHNVAINQTVNFFDQKLTLKGSVNYINQTTDNRQGAGLYFNPLTGLYFFPRGLDFETYRNDFETYSEARNINVQNWVADRDIQQNPWWILNRNQNSNTRNRYITSVSANYKITDNWSIQARGSLDKSLDLFTHEIYASTQGTLSDNNGRYIYQNYDDTQTYGDLILTYSNQLSSSLTLDANLGASHTDNKVYRVVADSKNGDLSFANQFGLQYIRNTTAAQDFREGLTRRKKNALFASAQLGLNSQLYFDVTARTDKSSALPNTSYFYPSVGVTAILTEMMDLQALDFAKFRASYAVVGNDVPAYVANDKEDRGDIVNGQLQFSTVGPIPGTELVPEESTSLEFGLDLRAVDNKLGLDLTYYKTNTKNQFINISAPAGSGFTRYLVNAGNVQNSGIEAALSYDVLSGSNLSWETSLNFTKNSNEIIEVHPEFDENEDAAFFITDEAVNSYRMVVQKGGSFGDIWGERFLRDDQGRIMLDVDGKPQKQGLGYVGNPNPDFMLGWNNEITIDKLSIRVLIDGRFGGEVMSVTEALLDEFGVSERTAAARDAGGVTVNAVSESGETVTSIPADVYYGAVGGRQGITEAYVYDATNIRLRELSIGYKLPDFILGGDAKISIVGRNLFFFSKKAPFDPDVTASTDVGLQGIDIFSLPSTRSIGFNLSLGF